MRMDIVYIDDVLNRTLDTRTRPRKIKLRQKYTAKLSKFPGKKRLICNRSISSTSGGPAQQHFPHHLLDMSGKNIDIRIGELMEDYVNECLGRGMDPSLLEVIEQWIPKRFLVRGNRFLEESFYKTIKVPTLLMTADFISEYRIF